MRIDPQISAIRGDRDAQRHLKLAMDAAHRSWRESLQVAQVSSELECYGEGTPLDCLPALGRLVADFEAGRAFVEGWCKVFLQALGTHPLAQMPFLHHHAGGYATMRLASAGRGGLTLALYEQSPQVDPSRSAVFSDREQHELVLAGIGRVTHYTLVKESGHRADITIDHLSLAPGERIETIGAGSTRRIDRVEGRLLVLQLARVPQRAGLTREFALPSGQLLRQSSGDKHASQHEMAMAVLGAMGRSDAAAAIANLAGEGPDHLRWEAVRHTLALDTRLGLELLARLADDGRDSLSDQAARLSRQLHHSFPQLALARRSETCPA